jgi:uncharacterized membrane protein YkoI
MQIKKFLATEVVVSVIGGGAVGVVAAAQSNTPAPVTSPVVVSPQVDKEVPDANEPADVAGAAEVKDANEPADVAGAAEVKDANEPADKAEAPEAVDPNEQAKLQKAATITKDQATAAALAQVSGTVKSVELEDENGTVVYGVSVLGADGKGYDVKVDAATGKVLKSEADDQEEK